ncbi:MAG: metal-dependent transcriptional regulator [Planctomycetes bacterium]|nr:metal-dependent transcriptional regulator [Planctomycetota bacterium]
MRTSPEPDLTHSAAHYLLAIAELLDAQGYARVTDVGRQLGLTRGSVSVGLRSLKAAGFLTQDENHFFRLTECGVTAVAGVRARHQVVERFLTEVLGLSSERAHRESCRVENLIEGPTARRLQALVDYWRERDLDGELEPRVKQGCPACPQNGPGHCPCCGLECLDNQGRCSLSPGDGDDAEGAHE